MSWESELKKYKEKINNIYLILVRLILKAILAFNLCM